MRNFLLLLLSFSLTFTTIYSQTPAYIIGPGEYQAFFIRSSDKSLWSVGGAVETQGIGTNPTGTLGTPIQVLLPAGTQVKSVSSPLHNGIAVDVNGNVWFWGANDAGQRGDGTVAGAVSYTPVQVAKDSLGNPFTNVNQVSCWWNEVGDLTPNASSGALVCKNDGTVWIWGNTIGGMRGNGQYGQENTKPVQINIPGNPHIVKVLAGEVCMALDNNGNVYTWGGNGRTDLLGTNNADYTNVHKVTLPKPAKDIAGADLFEYALATDGTLYGWGIYGAYLGIGTGPYLSANTFQPLPVDLTSDLNLPHPISSIMCNSVSTHVILTDGTLWGWGDNTEGNVGNGIDINFGTYPTPYAWDWGAAEVLQNKPVQIAPQVHNFTNMFGGTSACFYMYAEDATGQLYSWGRNKSEVLCNGVVGATSDLNASYPDGWDQPTITAVNPFSLKKIYPSTCPICLLSPKSSPCSEFPLPVNTPPKSAPGANQTITLPATTGVLNGSGSSDPDGVVVYYKWQQVSGPSANTVLDPTYGDTRIAGLVAGTYVYSLTVTDNGWATNTSTVTVVVKAAGATAPTVNAGGDPSITLPTSSVTLSGTAAGNGGATIKTTSWKELSGPVTAAIASPSSLTTTITGLTTAGTYVFQLTATDNNNQTSTGSVTVVVNAAAAAGAPPTVSAGKGQAIVLPTSSVEVAGTAAGVNGATIKVLSWKQDSGPVTATIASPSSLSTAVTGMTNPGNYVFSLYATDNNGKTAFGSMTVVVTGTAIPASSVAPTVSAGKGQAIVLPTSSVELVGTAAGNNGATIKTLNWVQDSGPVTVTIASPSSLSTAVTGITNPGNYVFSLYATDNNGKTAFGSMTVVVTGTATAPAKSTAPTTGIAPTVSAGKGQAITLPTSSTTLDGAASGNNGATIKTLNWVQESGPVTAKIASPSSATTTVTGMTTAGSYIFVLYATDNNGLTAYGSMTVIVNPDPSPTPPTVSAGKGEEVVLPTSSVTVVGTAAGTNGATISGVYWEFISGPAYVKFSNEWGLTTTISQLVAGTYVFELSVTDNHGLTSVSSVTVVVKPAGSTASVDSAEMAAQASEIADSMNNVSKALIFPNPAHDLLNLRLNNTGKGKVLVMIYDEMGRRVQTLQLEKDQWELQTSIDISRLAQGVYTIQTLTGTTIRTTSRFVKL